MAALRVWARCFSASSSSASRLTTEKIFKNITEMLKNIFHVFMVSMRALRSGMAKLVVLATFVIIRKHFICLSCFTKFCFSFFITWVAVWMVL